VRPLTGDGEPGVPAKGHKQQLKQSKILCLDKFEDNATAAYRMLKQQNKQAAL